MVPYPDEGKDATDQRRPSPRQLFIRLIGTNGKCIMDGELIRGLSIGLADIGECDLGEVVLPTKLNLCIATAALRDGN